MKKFLALLCAMMLLLSASLAETADPLAAADAFLQQMEALKLEAQIVDLEIQLATVKGDSAALSAAQSKKTTLLNDMARLSAQAVQSLDNAQNTLQQQADAIRAEIASLEDALTENEAQQKLLEARYEECMINGALQGSAKGFISDVTVYVILDEAGAISALHVDTSRETPFIGSRCGEDQAFLSQFIGQTIPLTAGVDVDVLAGATFTSNAVIEAANAAIGVAQHEVSLGSSTYSASAKGLLSDVQVTISVDASGCITDITVDASGETQAIARPCTEEAFLSQFIGRSAPFTGVDIVTGATFTSNAVINAINSIYEKGVVGK